MAMASLNHAIALWMVGRGVDDLHSQHLVYPCPQSSGELAALVRCDDGLDPIPGNPRGDEGVRTHLSQNGLDVALLQPSCGLVLSG